MPINVFISYSEVDKDKVKILRKALTKHKDYIKTIIVADRRFALIDLSDKVIQAIKESEILIPILTRKSIATQWINQEIGYSKAISNVKITPIVEESIIDKLKGFIHKQLDLPYVFRGKGNKISQNVNFKNCCDTLIHDLLTKNKMEGDSLVTPSDIFTGKWENRYKKYGNIYKEEFEIKDGYKYYANKEYYFDIIDFHFDKDARTLEFKKRAIRPGDKRLNSVKLEMVNPHYFKGTEYDVNSKEDTLHEIELKLVST